MKCNGVAGIHLIEASELSSPASAAPFPKWSFVAWVMRFFQRIAGARWRISTKRMKFHFPSHLRLPKLLSVQKEWGDPETGEKPGKSLVQLQTLNSISSHWRCLVRTCYDPSEFPGSSGLEILPWMLDSLMIFRVLALKMWDFSLFEVAHKPFSWQNPRQEDKPFQVDLQGLLYSRIFDNGVLE